MSQREVYAICLKNKNSATNEKENTGRALQDNLETLESNCGGVKPLKHSLTGKAARSQRQA